MSDTQSQIERETVEADVLIVGAGPAGLSAAIRLRQIASETGRDISVIVIEKAASVGAHIMSGAVLDPAGLARLYPDWATRNVPLGPKVTSEDMSWLTEKRALPIPGVLRPPQMHTKESYVASLGDLCVWLGEQAEAAGVDIFPGTAGQHPIIDDHGVLRGVITGDMGVAQDGTPRDDFAPGIELRARYTMIAEGARGSLAKELIARFGLDESSEPQTYGLGFKEIWEVPDEVHRPGHIAHYLGYPMEDGNFGGGFVYHAANRKVYAGLIVHLGYANPTLSPFDEFQKFKAHPEIAAVLKGGTRTAYGARAITSGGWNAVPQVSFPGGMLIGCSAGFVNLPRIKGIHNAMHSGIDAAEEVAAALVLPEAPDRLENYDARIASGPVGRDLKPVANMKGMVSKFGTRLGVLGGGFDMWVKALTPLSPATLLARGGKADSETLEPISEVTPLAYSPSGDTRTDSIFLSDIVHEEDQPVHLKLADPDLPVRENLPRYGEPATLYCPAGVYEIVDRGQGPEFRINAANCIHCKTCDIKDPAGNINWVPPAGGSGPNYNGM